MTRRLLVESKSHPADGVVELRLGCPEGRRLDGWAPGAHVEVTCAPGLVRPYSLCGDPGDLAKYRIAVLREPEGRGGSRALHDNVAEGDLLDVSAPRNNFPLEPAPEYLFIAGGIGITPLLPMITQVQADGARWRLLYGGRTRASMAFACELGALAPVTVVPQDEQGLLDLTGVLAGHPGDGLVYCCGPEPLLAAIEQGCDEAGLRSVLRVERFKPKAQPTGLVDAAFTVELAASGQELYIPEDRSILDVLRDAGHDVLSSCEEGTCGSCELSVLRGEPDHRDSFLTDEERNESDRMMVCVSRSRTPTLTLDL